MNLQEKINNDIGILEEKIESIEECFYKNRIDKIEDKLDVVINFIKELKQLLNN